MALFGVVFAAGAGSASAQITLSGDEDTTLDEGEFLEWTFTAKYQNIPGTTVLGILGVSPATVAAASTGTTTTGAPGAVTAAEVTGSPPDHRISHPFGFNFQHRPGPGSRATDTRSWRLRSIPDADAEDEKLTVTFSVVNGSMYYGQESPTPLLIPHGSSPGGVRTITIKDAQEQTFVWDTPTGAANTSPTEGTPTTRTLRADPAPDDLIWSVSLSLNEAGYRLDRSTASLQRANASPPTSPTHSITITPPDTDGNREDDTIELSAFLAGTNDLLPGSEPLEITFEDVHALPEAGKITAQAYEDREGAAAGRTTTEAGAVTEGGDPVHVRVTIDRGSKGYPSDEKLVVTPRVAPASAAGAADFTIEPASIEIAAGAGKRSADFVLTARADDDVGAETLDLELVTKGGTPANGPGEVVGTFSIDIVDATARLVAPKPDAAAEAYVMEAMGEGPLNPGDSFTLDVTELFDWTPAAVDVAFAASVRGPAARVSTSGETVTVEAKEAGEAVVTVTATAADKGSPAVGTSQTVANAASVTFDVRVVLTALEITLSAPDLNVVEGRERVPVTATANRAVTKQTKVRLDAVGDGSASPSDYSVDDITIEAGAMAGTAMLTARNDDYDERSETLTLRGVFVDDESGMDGETGTLTFHLWDAAVPALPAVASLLLAALLAVVGGRRHPRR